MNKKIIYSIIAGMLISTMVVFSQRGHHVLTGKITDENNNELVGATVYIEELGVGDDTNASGDYRIEHISGGRHRIMVSYMGYKPLTKEIDFKRGEQTR
ncbi:MAG TPA: carboxypeptidase-like regulatory domain-containing protein, partial [Petrimonas sp.]|nr:carboxypeptidase-like regulatory domain-containing protein [Petrimonas sp.]